MLKMKDILDEKDKRLRMVSEEVTFPMQKEDLKKIDLMVEYLTNSQIEEKAEKYDLRPGMGMAAIQLGIPKRYITIVEEVEDGFDTYVVVNPKIVSNSMEKIYVDQGEGCLSVNREVEGIVPRYGRKQDSSKSQRRVSNRFSTRNRSFKWDFVHRLYRP